MKKHIQTNEVKKTKQKKNVRNNRDNMNAQIDSNNSTMNSTTNKKPSKKNLKRKKKRLRIVLLILLILFILLGVYIGILFSKAPDGLSFKAKISYVVLHLFDFKEDTPLQELDKLQVLILGESTGMSDTIVVAQYDPKVQEAALLSIPRDTFVGKDIYHAKASDKINSKYSHGETIQDTVDAVNELTGLNINYYILVDTAALNKLVDIIGGLDFNVPMNMNYDDSSQDLHIHLKAGQQKLTGNQVEQLVRFRHNNDGSSYYRVYGVGEDFGRMRTQREVITALASQTLKFKNITEIFKIIDVLKSYVKTNIDLDGVKAYIPYAIDMNMDNLKTGQLPGHDGPSGGVYVFAPDLEATKELVDELFNGIVKPEPGEDTEGDNTTPNND